MPKINLHAHLEEVNAEIRRAIEAGASTDYVRGLQTARTMLHMRMMESRNKAKEDGNNDNGN
jgi:hypothetical protein